MDKGNACLPAMRNLALVGAHGNATRIGGRTGWQQVRRGSGGDAIP